MTTWQDYQTALTTLAGLEAEVQRKFDQAETAFRRSADDLARAKNTADSQWLDTAERARAAKATGQALSARAGIAQSSAASTLEIQRESADQVLADLEQTTHWCEQATGWLTRHQQRLAQYQRQQAALDAQPAAAPPATAPTPKPTKATGAGKKALVGAGIGLVILIAVVIMVVVL